MGLWKRGNVWWAYFCVDGIRHQSSTGNVESQTRRIHFAETQGDANGRRHEVVVTDPKVSLRPSRHSCCGCQSV